MAIEFNGKGKINNFAIGKDLPKSKDVEKEEKVEQEQQVFDNKFVKELGEELLTANVASAFGANFNKVEGIKIDKDFWGDAIKGLNLKDTAISADTSAKIAQLDNAFAVIDMENKMAQSPFMKALNKEFDIS